MIDVVYLCEAGLMPAIIGMRNSWESWDRMDTMKEGGEYKIGPEDLKLMRKLIVAGQPHRKFLRMMVVYLNVTAPLYWWKQFDTYKVGTVTNSTSTMHCITKKEFELSDFSWENMSEEGIEALEKTIETLNHLRDVYLYGNDSGLKKGSPDIWYTIIQLLPSSYNQTRTVMLSYENLYSIKEWRSSHKLAEWRKFISECEKRTLYMKELFSKEEEKKDEQKG